jgi:hypothetical protein
VLRLNFRSVRGDSPTLMLANCVRFCADGTLRGPDNYVIARCLDGGWQVGGRMHRELECEGPVRVRLTMGANDKPRLLGPFRTLRTAAGMLYGDDACLHVLMPGHRTQGEGLCFQLTMLFEGESNAKA